MIRTPLQPRRTHAVGLHGRTRLGHLVGVEVDERLAGVDVAHRDRPAAVRVLRLLHHGTCGLVEAVRLTARRRRRGARLGAGGRARRAGGARCGRARHSGRRGRIGIVIRRVARGQRPNCERNQGGTERKASPPHDASIRSGLAWPATLIVTVAVVAPGAPRRRDREQRTSRSWVAPLSPALGGHPKPTPRFGQLAAAQALADVAALFLDRGKELADDVFGPCRNLANPVGLDDLGHVTRAAGPARRVAPVCVAHLGGLRSPNVSRRRNLGVCPR